MKQVYFMRGVGMVGPIKIGCSDYPSRRLRNHEASSPVELEIIAIIDGPHELERRFHGAFKDSHLRCEWFAWTEELQRTIDQINAGTFSPDVLPAPHHLPRRNPGRSKRSPLPCAAMGATRRTPAKANRNLRCRTPLVASHPLPRAEN